MKEEWREIEGFPKYLVSNHGRVYNMQRQLIKTPGANQQGIATISLSRDNVPAMRAICLLVANAFLEKPDPSFDTPINLDGDRHNNSVNNLAWRPRPFAILYHRQFHFVSFREIPVDIELVETGEKFEDLATPAVKYGLIYTHIIRSYVHGVDVFPMSFHFRLI